MNEVKESLVAAISLSPRDWSLYHRDAWIYGIVIGWGGALKGVVEKHGWKRETVERIIDLHCEFTKEEN